MTTSDVTCGLPEKSKLCALGDCLCALGETRENCYRHFLESLQKIYENGLKADKPHRMLIEHKNL